MGPARGPVFVLLEAQPVDRQVAMASMPVRGWSMSAPGSAVTEPALNGPCSSCGLPTDGQYRVWTTTGGRAGTDHVTEHHVLLCPGCAKKHARLWRATGLLFVAVGFSVLVAFITSPVTGEVPLPVALGPIALIAVGMYLAILPGTRRWCQARAARQLRRSGLKCARVYFKPPQGSPGRNVARATHPFAKTPIGHPGRQVVSLREGVRCSRDATGSTGS